jgi:hypothetical protein
MNLNHACESTVTHTHPNDKDHARPFHQEPQVKAEISTRLKEIGVLGVRIPPLAIPFGFRLLSHFCAVLASFFVLAYAALILLVGWAAYFVALASGPAFGPRSTLHGVIVSLIVLLGSALILSQVKPLLAPAAQSLQPHSLDAEQQPLLAAFVQELASVIGSPAPSRIAVDCNVNCHCLFSGGLGTTFRSDFVLVIGLPLVAGLRLGQFAGVLAHELSHVAQVRALRSSCFIWSVHAWFSRVVFERDRVDEQLLAYAATGRTAVKLFSCVAQSLARPGRAALRVLMLGESLVSSIFLRHLELEADRYQVRVAGTEGFIAGVSELNLLEVAAQRAVVELSRMKREGHLADNYPGLILAIRRRYSEEFVEQLLAGVEGRKTGIFAVHPCDKDRIAMARAEKKPALIPATLPASVLFGNFAALCRQVTLEFYRQELGIEVVAGG